MECYKKCVEIGKHCANCYSRGSCADCGKACRSNFLITSRTNCRCSATHPSSQCKATDKTTVSGSQGAKQQEQHQDQNQQHQQYTDEGEENQTQDSPRQQQHPVEEEEEQTWWQWLLSLFGFGKVKKQTQTTFFEKTTSSKGSQWRSGVQKPVEVLSPATILAEANELCYEIKKQKPDPYQPSVEQATSPLPSPKKEEKGSETQLSPGPAERKKKTRGKSPPRSASREKYLGRPLDSSPKQRSPRSGSPRYGRSKSPAQKDKESSQTPDKEAHVTNVTNVTKVTNEITKTCVEEKRPPTSPIYSSQRYLQSYVCETCPVDLICSECCCTSSAHISSSVCSYRKKKKPGKRAKKSKCSPSSSCTMPCCSSKCLVCCGKTCPPTCCSAVSMTARKTSCCPQSPCFCLDEITRDMRRRRHSVSPCGNRSPCGKRNRSSSCPTPGFCRPSCSPCCPSRCPKPCCCSSCCIPPALCRTCTGLTCSKSLTPCPPSSCYPTRSCCSPVFPSSQCCIPPRCSIGPGCPCPITCTRPCCVPCFPRPKQPCQSPLPSAFNRYQPLHTFGMSSYSRSRDNDALCKHLMAKYRVTAPESTPFCPKPSGRICGPCEYAPKAGPLTYPIPINAPGCPSPRCGNCMGCNNNKLTSTPFGNCFENYPSTTMPSSSYQQPVQEPITFNKSPSQGQPRIEFRIPKRTPVICIKQTGPRSPCKEFQSTFNFRKAAKKDKMLKDPVAQIEDAPVAEDKVSKSPQKSGIKKRKASPTKSRKGGSKEKVPTSDSQQNMSDNKKIPDNDFNSTSTLPSSFVTWRASSQRVSKMGIRGKTIEKNRKPKNKQSDRSRLVPILDSKPHYEEKLCSPTIKRRSNILNGEISTFSGKYNGSMHLYSCAPKSLSPILKFSTPKSEESQNKAELCSPVPKRRSPLFTSPNAVTEGNHFSGKQFSPITKSFNLKFLNLSASPQLGRQSKMLHIIPKRLGRRNLSLPAFNKSSSLQMGSNNKAMSCSPLLKPDLTFSKMAISDHSLYRYESYKPQQSRPSYPWSKQSPPVIMASKSPSSEVPEKTCHDLSDHSIIKAGSVTSVTVEQNKEVPMCLETDNIKKFQCVTIEPTEVESISSLLGKLYRVEVSAVGVMAQSKCNIFDYISVENSPAITSPTRGNSLPLLVEDLSNEEENKAGEEDPLPSTEEKHDTVTELVEQEDTNKEAKLGEMNSIGSTVDCANGDNVIQDEKVDLIAMSYDRDATIKVASSVANQYRIPLFDFRLNIFPQRVDMRKIPDIFAVGGSSVDPVEFGIIGESAVDPVKNKVPSEDCEHSRLLYSGVNHSNNNNEDNPGSEPCKDSVEPPEAAELTHNVSDIPDVKSDKPGAGAQNKEENPSSKEKAEDTDLSDDKSKSALEELLACSGVKWNKVAESSDAELRLIRLGKAALKIRNRPDPTSSNSSEQHKPYGSNSSPVANQPESDAKPYVQLLKPGVIETSGISSDLEEINLLKDSSVERYGTPV